MQRGSTTDPALNPRLEPAEGPGCSKAKCSSVQLGDVTGGSAGRAGRRCKGWSPWGVREVLCRAEAGATLNVAAGPGSGSPTRAILSGLRLRDALRAPSDAPPAPPPSKCDMAMAGPGRARAGQGRAALHMALLERTQVSPATQGTKPTAQGAECLAWLALALTRSGKPNPTLGWTERRQASGSAGRETDARASSARSAPC